MRSTRSRRRPISQAASAKVAGSSCPPSPPSKTRSPPPSASAPASSPTASRRSRSCSSHWIRRPFSRCGAVLRLPGRTRWPSSARAMLRRRSACGKPQDRHGRHPRRRHRPFYIRPSTRGSTARSRPGPDRLGKPHGLQSARRISPAATASSPAAPGARSWSWRRSGPARSSLPAGPANRAAR